MANLFYRKARQKILQDVIELSTDTLKIVLVDTGFTPGAGDEFVDDGTANDVSSHEINGTGYTAGFGSASRVAVSSKAFGVSVGDDKGYFDFADITYIGLNLGDIGGAVLIKETGGSDTTSLVIGFYDPTNFTTNGGNVLLQVNANGALRY